MLSLALVVIVTLYHFTHIIECLRTAEISMFADRVVIIFGIAFQADILGNVVFPDVRVLSLVFGQALSVIDMSDAGIVRG